MDVLQSHVSDCAAAIDPCTISQRMTRKGRCVSSASPWANAATSLAKRASANARVRQPRGKCRLVLQRLPSNLFSALLMLENESLFTVGTIYAAIKHVAPFSSAS
jgi:hypothetical protein